MSRIDNDELDEAWSDDADYYYDDDEYVPLPRLGERARKVVVTVVAMLAVMGIISAVTLIWVARQVNPPGIEGPQLASVNIPTGSSISSIGRLLEDKRVIGSASVFELYAKLRGLNIPKAGNYVSFHTNSSMSAVADVLDAGPLPVASVSLTIIPGKRLVDAFDKIHQVFPAISVTQLQLTLASGQVKSKYLPAGVTNWEGYLLPETYQFKKDASALTVLQKIVKQFDKTLDSLGYANATTTAGRSAYDLVTIASMIERETGDPPDERGKIARVISNRLDKKEPLGIDATILYGLNRRGGSADPLTKTDLETDTPYNSRKHAGLPPTPISLPSKQSLKAAINPEVGSWFYYVLINDNPREHFFTASPQEFAAAKAEAQKKGLI